MDKWDYIIVGAGSAGCVLANRLSADRDINVLLIESGGRNSSPMLRIPAAMGRSMAHPKYSWNYPVEPDPTRNHKVDLWPSGKGLGGSSAINGLFYTRGQPQDFDAWAAQGNNAWCWEEVEPYFQKIEYNESKQQPSVRKSGLQSVARLCEVHPLADAFVEASTELGIPYVEDNRGERSSGVSLVNVTQKNGRRHSVADAYLRPIEKRPNLKIMTETVCQRLLIENGVCRGIEYSKNDSTSVALAGAEVILSAGAVGSPKLLLLSGIGPENQLRDIGIPVHIDLAGVGRNLQEHPNVGITFDVTLPTYNLDARRSLKVLWHLLRWWVSGTGPATSPYAQAAAFYNSIDLTGRPDLEILFAPHNFEWTEEGLRASPRAGVNGVVSLCRPNCRGTLRLRSKDPLDPPVIDFPLLSDDDDLRMLRNGCRMVRKIFAAPAMLQYVEKERAPGAQTQTDQEWDEYIRDAVFGGNHLSGTCKMGSEKDAVVDSELRVHGLDRLRVVDASIMPTLISAHTNAATIMIAEKASVDILAARR